MDEKKALEGIGLTNGEIKVYLALLEIGSNTTGEIIKKAKVSRSKVYEMLDRLIERGLVSFVIKEKTRYFEPADPSQIIDYLKKEKKKIEEKESKVKEILPLLKQKKKSAKKPQTATIYEGANGIKTIYNEVLDSLKKGEEYYAITAESEVNQEAAFATFIQNFHKKREEKKIKVKILSPLENKEITSKVFEKNKLIQIRYFSQKIPGAMLIFRDNIATYFWGKESKGVVIRSKEIAGRYKEFFEDIWSSSQQTTN